MIDGIKSGIGAIKSIPTLDKAQGSQGTPTQGSFSDALKSAIGEVDKLQREADGKIKGLTLGEAGVTPHDAMIALQKADVAFQLMSTIRTKIVQAYQEVIRTQV
jgi:flagellar hook-basal body complex protein FliE